MLLVEEITLPTDKGTLGTKDTGMYALLNSMTTEISMTKAGNLVLGNHLDTPFLKREQYLLNEF